MIKRIGKHTARLENPVYIISASSTAGKKEGEGPLGKMFDKVLDDDMFGEESWEKAESKLVRENFENAIKKSGMTADNIDICIAGDLLNQVSATTFGVRVLIYLLWGYTELAPQWENLWEWELCLLTEDLRKIYLAGASSHFCAAEKQYRAPLGMGNQRPQTSTWTVTGDGAVVLSKNKKANAPVITEVLTGSVVDMGVKDPNNMGAAMAPAAAELMISYFEETGRTPDYFDVIATGDLGYVGKTLTIELLAAEGYVLNDSYTDCGIEIYDREKQDTHSGGSGCACSALVFTSKFYKMLTEGKIKRMLLMPTGALMSPTTSQQGESIPSIAHGIVIESRC